MATMREMHTNLVGAARFKFHIYISESGEALSHQEVTDTATAIRSTFEGLLDEILSRLNAAETK